MFVQFFYSRFTGHIRRLHSTETLLLTIDDISQLGRLCSGLGPWFIFHLYWFILAEGIVDVRHKWDAATRLVHATYIRYRYMYIKRNGFNIQKERIRLQSVPNAAHFYSQYITTSEGVKYREAHSRAARKKIHQKVCQSTLKVENTNSNTNCYYSHTNSYFFRQIILCIISNI